MSTKLQRKTQLNNKMYGHMHMSLKEGRFIPKKSEPNGEEKQSEMPCGIGYLLFWSFRHFLTLRLCSASVLANTWPPFPSATK